MNGDYNSNYINETTRHDVENETATTTTLDRGAAPRGGLCDAGRINGDYNSNYINETTRHDNIQGTRSDKTTSHRRT